MTIKSFPTLAVASAATGVLLDRDTHQHTRADPGGDMTDEDVRRVPAETLAMLQHRVTGRLLATGTQGIVHVDVVLMQQLLDEIQEHRSAVTVPTDPPTTSPSPTEET